MKCECSIRFMLTKNFFFVILENGFAVPSDCESHQNAKHTLRAVCRRIPQLYTANNSANDGICWNLNWLIRWIEAGCKIRMLMYMEDMNFVVIIFKYSPSFLNTLFFLFLPEEACNQNLIWNSVLYPFDQRCHPYAGESFGIRTLKSPCSSVLPFIY